MEGVSAKKYGQDEVSDSVKVKMLQLKKIEEVQFSYNISASILIFKLPDWFDLFLDGM